MNGKRNLRNNEDCHVLCEKLYRAIITSGVEHNMFYLVQFSYKLSE